MVGGALAERIRQGRRWQRHWKGFGGEWVDAPEDAAAESARVAALEEQVTLLNSQVSELAERLDFAERMLAERRGRTLGAGPHGNTLSHLHAVLVEHPRTDLARRKIPENAQPAPRR